MFLSAKELENLVALRRRLHEQPELSGEEGETAGAVLSFLSIAPPDRLIKNLGGHGLAAVYEGAKPGPTLMFRAELDALPIEEVSDAPHRSKIPGKAHLCGHDGHTAALLALALGFSRARPKRGRAVLLFQPAEENGVGAAAVIADPKFAEIAPDFVFAWHNMPGLPLGQVALAAGPMNCASRGMRAILSGAASHASTPELGLSPLHAVAKLMPKLTALGRGGLLDAGYSLVTVTHVEMGERAFGVAPGGAEIWATLRTLTDATMAALVEKAERLVRDTAHAENLRARIVYQDVFAHCENAPAAVELIARALDAERVSWELAGMPMRASEDFGRFSAKAPSAMFLVGAGEGHASLHNPDYDFPDDLIAIASRVMMRIARETLG